MKLLDCLDEKEATAAALDLYRQMQDIELWVRDGFGHRTVVIEPYTNTGPAKWRATVVLESDAAVGVARSPTKDAEDPEPTELRVQGGGDTPGQAWAVAMSNLYSLVGASQSSYRR